jgi:hypothetical protein
LRAEAALVRGASALNITVPESTIYMELPTLVTVHATDGTFDTAAGSRARCRIQSANDHYVNQNYTDDGYNPMKNLSATVVDTGTLTCVTVPTQNGSPGHLSVSMDNGQTWSNTTVIEVVPAFEWALSQRPFYGDDAAGIVYNVHPSLSGTVFKLSGVLRPHQGNETFFAPRYFEHHTTVGPFLARTGALPLLLTTVTARAPPDLRGSVAFSLGGLPPTVYEDFVLTVSWVAAKSRHTVSATKMKRLHRAPLPPSGSNVTMFSVDHTTASMLSAQGEGSTSGPYLPFTALGWFNSPFEYTHESVGDMSLVSQDVNMFVARGGSFATEWGKKGHSLLRIGCDHQNDPDLLLAILDECERAGVYAMYTPSMANNIANTGQGGFDMAGLVSNITLVKDHPALWGYYICEREAPPLSPCALLCLRTEAEIGCRAVPSRAPQVTIAARVSTFCGSWPGSSTPSRG